MKKITYLLSVLFLPVGMATATAQLVSPIVVPAGVANAAAAIVEAQNCQCDECICDPCKCNAGKCEGKIAAEEKPAPVEKEAKNKPFNGKKLQAKLDAKKAGKKGKCCGECKEGQGDGKKPDVDFPEMPVQEEPAPKEDCGTEKVPPMPMPENGDGEEASDSRCPGKAE